MYFSLTHEALFLKQILGFNGYFLHSIYDIKKNGFCLFGFKQLIVFLNIVGLLGGRVSSTIIFGLEYFFEILREGGMLRKKIGSLVATGNFLVATKLFTENNQNFSGSYQKILILKNLRNKTK